MKPAGYWLRGGAGAGASGIYQDQMFSALFPPSSSDFICLAPLYELKKVRYDLFTASGLFLGSQVDSADCTTEQVHLSTIYKVDSEKLTHTVLYV